MMKILITAGPTREPIDPVRYIGNRSSGRMGAALAEAGLAAGHAVTLIVGPVSVAMPAEAVRINVETAAQMHEAAMREFPSHALLIMAAAVADYRPKSISRGKISRHGALTIECEPTQDIIAAAGRIKRPDQRTMPAVLVLALAVAAPDLTHFLILPPWLTVFTATGHGSKIVPSRSVLPE